MQCNKVKLIVRYLSGTTYICLHISGYRRNLPVYPHRWQIPNDAPVTHTPYDLVADKTPPAAGFVAPVPEAATVMLFPVGLVVLRGYVYVSLRTRRN